jgi:glycine dehydrogenase subunit 1
MRYLPHTEEDIAAMLGAVGLGELDDFFAAIPADCRFGEALDLPEAMSEWVLERHVGGLAGRMAVSPEYALFLGAGSYDHYIPATVSSLLGRSEFVTSYTPYQPEMLQGTLQGIYEYQTLTARLLGMEVATASHYDGATALAEALLMAVRITKRKKAALSRAIHPHYRQVVRTYFAPTGYELLEIPCLETGLTDLDRIGETGDLAAVAVQSPNFFGCIEDVQAAAERAHSGGALLVAGFTEALAFGLLKSPGSLGADIVAGEGQSLGIPRSFGGPALGMLASRKQHMRNLPGRLVGKTEDRDGRRGFVLTLATREQHIRREKATSNICSNNSLCALAAAMTMASLGGDRHSGAGRPQPRQGGIPEERATGCGLHDPFFRPHVQRIRRRLSRRLRRPVPAVAREEDRGRVAAGRLLSGTDGSRPHLCHGDVQPGRDGPSGP